MQGYARLKLIVDTQLCYKSGIFIWLKTDLYYKFKSEPAWDSLNIFFPPEEFQSLMEVLNAIELALA